MKKDFTDKTLHELLSGSHPLTEKYAGKQVFVINSEIAAFIPALRKRGFLRCDYKLGIFKKRLDPKRKELAEFFSF